MFACCEAGREAIGRAGLDYSRIRKREKWPKQRVIEIIRELQGEGMRLTTHALQKSGYGKLVSPVRNNRGRFLTGQGQKGGGNLQIAQEALNT